MVMMPCSLTASLALAGAVTALQYLAPEQDINLPSSKSAREPLQWLGANGPYHAGERAREAFFLFPPSAVHLES